MDITGKKCCRGENQLSFSPTFKRREFLTINFFLPQDGTFSVLDFCDAFLENEVQRVLRAYPDTITIDIHCAQLGHWSSLPDKNFTKLCKIRINPVDILDSGNEKLNAFTGERERKMD